MNIEKSQISKNHTRKKENIWILVNNQNDYQEVYLSALQYTFDINIFFDFAAFDKAICNEKLTKPLLVITDIKLSRVEKIKDKILPTPLTVVLSNDNSSFLRYYINHSSISCLMKPFNQKELLLKVNSVINNSRSVLTHYGLRFTKQVIDGAEIKNLTLKQKKILTMFMSSKDRTLSREQIQKEIWQNIVVHPKTIDVHLYNLRKKIKEYGFLITSDYKQRWLLHPVS